MRIRKEKPKVERVIVCVCALVEREDGSIYGFAIIDDAAAAVPLMIDLS
jgi:hypothetical protein